MSNVIKVLGGSKIHHDLVKILKKIVIFLETDIQYPEKLNDLHNDLPFLPERMKIEKTCSQFEQ